LSSNHINPVFFGRLRQSGNVVLARHRHPKSYLALILSGGYEEVGDRGRYRVRAGDVLVHSAFEAHLNRYAPGGSDVLTLAIPLQRDHASVLRRLSDPDYIMRLAEKDKKEALEAAFATMTPAVATTFDWPDQLIFDMQRDPRLCLREWAMAHELTDSAVSRGFKKVFGLSPSAYRAELKARFAWELIVTTGESLSAVAAAAGFCDQAHMTHNVRKVTGGTPGLWRKVK
jgi:AraC-like DNA-binding protein